MRQWSISIQSRDTVQTCGIEELKFFKNSIEIEISSFSAQCHDSRRKLFTDNNNLKTKENQSF